MHISDIRQDYQREQLHESTLLADPLQQFQLWLQQAIDFPIAEPTAMCLSTVSREGQPSARILLLKNIDAGLVFFTNYLSRKGKELADNPKACATFFWQPLERQVRIEGMVHKISPAQSQGYFNTRPLLSRLGAIASPQSQPVASRAELEKLLQQITQRYQDQNPPCPENWGGYCLVPHYWEFWQGGSSRLHDRIVYQQVSSVWQKQRLAP